MSKAVETAADPDGSPTRYDTGFLLRRLLIFARPYVLLLVAVFACTIVFSAGRYARAYLTKPLLDGVLLPTTDPGAKAPGPGANTAVLSPWEAAVGEWFSAPNPLGRAPSSDGTAAESTDAPSAMEVHRAKTFIQLLWAALVIVLVTPLALFGRAYLSEFALGRMSIDLKRALAAKLLRLPLSAHVDRASGDVMSRALVDSDGAGRALQLVFQDLLLATVMLVAGLATLVYISLPLTLISLVAAPPVVAVLVGFGRRTRKNAERRQTQLGEVTQRLIAILSGIKVIKAFGAEAAENRAFSMQAERLFRRDMRVTKNRVLPQSIIEAMNSAAGIVMLGVGTWLVVRGRFGLSTGDVVAFATVLATTYRPIKNGAKAYGRLNEHLASAKRYFEIFDTEEDPEDASEAVDLPSGPLPIHFENVGFRYPATEASGSTDSDQPWVIESVDFEIAPGEVVAFVGSTGAGKSTLVDLLLRFHDVERGSVRLGGIDVRHIARQQLRQRIAVVGQEPFLFDATIEENIRYGRPDANEAEIRAAAKAAHVDGFASELPMGLETRVGEFGLRLSGGQRQRIALARALLRNAEIFIFDEATSALDGETERLVQDAIDRLRGDRIIWIVAHRVSTIRRADRALVLEGGRIHEDGPVGQLEKSASRFREIVGA